MEILSSTNTENFVVFAVQFHRKVSLISIYKKKCIFKGKIDVILQYLKTNKSFKNYNKFVYAYRINQQIAPFVTQNEVSSEEVLLHTSFNFLNKHKQ